MNIEKYKVAIEIYSDFLSWYFDKYLKDNFRDFCNDCEFYKSRHEDMASVTIKFLNCKSSKEIFDSFIIFVKEDVGYEEFDDGEEKYYKAQKFVKKLKKELKKLDKLDTKKDIDKDIKNDKK
jgi:hypothetical protein